MLNELIIVYIPINTSYYESGCLITNIIVLNNFLRLAILYYNLYNTALFLG